MSLNNLWLNNNQRLFNNNQHLEQVMFNNNQQLDHMLSQLLFKTQA